ncbi:uncharacterized protein LOC133447318 isoform X3 [Cololabis saira]|uniref:uncharacterized protein LOC133447318 isoform X3 n=1 Tax=Cololabis saira TaxID=129043 RepID=UPI002AD54005|nr:uncharacterized protein LOC133447318 isoform X3 [Cololabis saira]
MLVLLQASRFRLVSFHKVQFLLNEMTVFQGLWPRAEVAARSLVQLLAREMSSAPSTAGQSTAGQSTAVRAEGRASLSGSDGSVRQAMRRQFPSMFNNRDQPRGKRRFSTPAPCIVKRTDFYVYVLSEPSKLTPKGSEELELAHAGLGKRMLSMPDQLTHNEIVALLEDEFPKLRTLQGGWMFYKGSGGSGRRKLTIIPTDAEGYSTRLLKSASNNGKNILFVVPLQEKLSTEPLAYDSVEFSKMPQSKCIACGSQMPLQLLPLHVEGCDGSSAENESGTCMDEDSSVHENPVPSTMGINEILRICPICHVSYPAEIISFHASTCGERMNCAQQNVVASPPREEELPGPSVPQLSAASTWANEVDPQKACQLFREELLNRFSESPRLSLSLDMFDAEEEQDSAIIAFYKLKNIHWAAPFQCRLRGDAAVGDGVNRHVLSMAMQKLKTGFILNLGSAAPTTLFDGEKEHRVPSAAAVLRDSNLFEMAGHMIGHSFLHGGIGFSGLSLPVVTVLTGGSSETAASVLTLEDCPDIDHRQTIGLLKNDELTAEENTKVTDLCLSWDFPFPTSTNRVWLFQELLSHAVLHRVKQQIKQIRKGLKETGIWPIISDRPDVHPLIFPRESSEKLNPQSLIQGITWPQPSCDSDEDEDDTVPLEKIALVTGYLRKFIEEATPDVLRDLTKFWVGWERPTGNMNVEVVTSTYPVALTCFMKLKLPSHYQSYTSFQQDLMMALTSIDSGFGLV